jgi:hypothetical protein
MDQVTTTAEAFVRASEGLHWDAQELVATRNAMFAATGASDTRDAAFAVLIARLEQGSCADADALAYVALAAGALVEQGADPEPLSRVLARHLPEVLVRARRHADRCLSHPSLVDADDEPPDEDPNDPFLAYVDGIDLRRSIVRSVLEAEVGDLAALVHLRQWVLPAVASWTRVRSQLATLRGVPGLFDAVSAMRDSEAAWLEKLLAAQVDAPWRLVLMRPGEVTRVFDVRVDQVTTNFELHEEVERALSSVGLTAAPRRDDHVASSFELALPSAAQHLARTPHTSLPMTDIVWREGLPTDVPIWPEGPMGRRTLLLAPATIRRSWSAGRTFAALEPEVRIERELTGGERRAWLDRLGVT